MKPGLAALSIHSGEPVIPCLLIGSDQLYNPSNWLRRTTLYLVIGEPVEPPKEDGNVVKISGLPMLASDSQKISPSLYDNERRSHRSIRSQTRGSTTDSSGQKGKHP